MLIQIPTNLDSGQIATIAAGFFFVMWIMTMRRKPKEKRWYSTDLPSTLHIEKEA